MNILKILEAVQNGSIAPDEAARTLRYQPFEELLGGDNTGHSASNSADNASEVNIDTHRALRTGHVECVFAQGKSDARLLSAVRSIAGAGAGSNTYASDATTPHNGSPVLATRVSQQQGELLLQNFPEGTFWAEAGIFTLNKDLPLAAPWSVSGDVMIITAGASDLPVALEALATANFYGVRAGLAPDIGVAGIHRIKPWLKAIDEAKILIVIAGMEGALASVIAGLCNKPVLAVPVSVGYGVSAGGFAALISMLSACAPGISVFNIDNGYGAAMFAARMLQQFDTSAQPS